jgi:hypothetical protein
MELEINSMVIKSKTYCEKWPIGCQTCDLTLCDRKKDMHDHFRDDTKMAGLSRECKDNGCKKCWLDWLREEAKE